MFLYLSIVHDVLSIHGHGYGLAWCLGVWTWSVCSMVSVSSFLWILSSGTTSRYDVTRYDVRHIGGSFHIWVGMDGTVGKALGLVGCIRICIARLELR